MFNESNTVEAYLYDLLPGQAKSLTGVTALPLKLPPLTPPDSSGCCWNTPERKNPAKLGAWRGFWKSPDCSGMVFGGGFRN